MGIEDAFPDFAGEDSFIDELAREVLFLVADVSTRGQLKDLVEMALTAKEEQEVAITLEQIYRGLVAAGLVKKRCRMSHAQFQFYLAANWCFPYSDSKPFSARSSSAASVPLALTRSLLRHSLAYTIGTAPALPACIVKCAISKRRISRTLAG